MNKKGLILLTIIVFCLTGCVKYDIENGVREDKSFKLTIINAMSNEYVNGNNEINDTNELNKLGYQVEEYKDQTHTGIKLIKIFNSIDDISSSDCDNFELTTLLEKNINEVKLFKSTKEKNITTYIANFTFDLSLEETNQNTGDFDYSEYSEQMIFKYTFSIPDNFQIISENADEKTNNGNTLTWNMEYGKIKNINFTFSINDNDIKDKIENIPSNNNETNNNTNNNNLPLEENTTNKEEIEENTNEITATKPAETNLLSSVFAIVIIIGLFGGFIVYKIKMKKDSVTPSMEMTHSQPPKRK